VYSKVQRQVQIMILLSESPFGMTVQNLVQALQRNGFDTNARTVRRDLTDLSEVFHISVEGTAKAPIYTMSNIHMNGVSFGFEDMQAFQLLKELARPYDHVAIGRRMCLFLKQLEDSLPATQRKWLTKAAKILTVNPGVIQEEKDVPLHIKKEIEKGISEQRCVQIKYYAFSSCTITDRIIEPIQLEFYEGCQHLWAYCRTKQEIRDFRLSRILAAHSLSESFEPKLDLLNTAMKNRFERMSTSVAETVVLRFRGYTARFVKEYFKTRSDSMQQESDGSVLFTRTAGITDDFIRWIMGFGSQVEVIKPESLRERISQEAYKVVGMYMKAN